METVDHFHYRTWREEFNSFPALYFQSSGEMLESHMWGDILKSYSGAESGPSYSKANMWSLHVAAL